MTRLTNAFAATVLSLLVVGTAAAEDNVVDFGDAIPTLSQLRSAFGGREPTLFGGNTQQIMIQHGGGAPPAPAMQVTPAATPVPVPRATARPSPQPRSPSAATPSHASPRGVSMPIQFEYNSASVKPEYEAHIARMAEYLQSEPAINLVIVGHTDATGSGAYNQRLSERRAAAVLGALQRYGVSGSRLRAEGHGETQPRVSNPYAGENRRVEFLNFN